MFAVQREDSLGGDTSNQCLWFKAKFSVLQEWSKCLGQSSRGKALCYRKMGEVFWNQCNFFILDGCCHQRVPEVTSSEPVVGWGKIGLRTWKQGLCLLALSMAWFGKMWWSRVWDVGHSTLLETPEGSGVSSALWQSFNHNIVQERRLLPSRKFIWPYYRGYRIKYLCKFYDNSPWTKRHYVR